jgi:tetratricopeptide (TPR) repeat protein
MRCLVVTLLVLLSAAAAHAQGCGYPGDEPGRFGPHNYSDPTKDKERYLVDGAHFSPYVEEMALYGFSSHRANSTEAEGQNLIGGNIDYTLYAFPNHTRALYAMGMWQLKQRKQSQLEYERMLRSTRLRTAECYFERAIMFVPNDGMVHAVYGAFLHKAGALQKAVTEYERAIELMPDNPEPHYNLGLLYVDLKNYPKAQEQAAIAYGAGYPLQGLKQKLARAQSGSRAPSPTATPKTE